jgi:hypothetical protein
MSMSKSHTVDVPIRIIQQLQGVFAELEHVISPYEAGFLARMYRARASDLEGKGKSVEEVTQSFEQTS